VRSVGLQSYELNWLTYIGQDFVVCGDHLCYSLADEGTQEKTSPDESCITGEGHGSPFHLMANSKDGFVLTNNGGTCYNNYKNLIEIPGTLFIQG